MWGGRGARRAGAQLLLLLLRRPPMQPGVGLAARPHSTWGCPASLAPHGLWFRQRLFNSGGPDRLTAEAAAAAAAEAEVAPLLQAVALTDTERGRHRV